MKTGLILLVGICMAGCISSSRSKEIYYGHTFIIVDNINESNRPYHDPNCEYCKMLDQISTSAVMQLKVMKGN